MEIDELLHVQKLVLPGSEAAPIIMQLKTERGHIREAMGVPRRNHPARTTLANILCGARYKYASMGRAGAYGMPKRNQTRRDMR